MSQPHPSGADDAPANLSPNLGAKLQHLWAPWRMQYVGGHAREEGCLFCNRLHAENDVAALVLLRAARSFVIMNLFPYNTGHLMLVPNEHVAGPEEAAPAALAEMARLLPAILRAQRRVLGCDGFNVGINVGAVAGAGVAEHLHEHVVPRWTGDANFMPILASTMVMPELIPVTYAKLRAEIVRELEPPGATNPMRVTAVALTPEAERVLVVRAPGGAHLPRATAAPDEPLWRVARHALAEFGLVADVAGWAGPNRALPGGAIALTFISRADVAPPAGAGHPAAFFPAADALAQLAAGDRAIVESALANLAPQG